MMKERREIRKKEKKENQLLMDLFVAVTNSCRKKEGTLPLYLREATSLKP